MAKRTDAASSNVVSIDAALAAATPMERRRPGSPLRNPPATDEKPAGQGEPEPARPLDTVDLLACEPQSPRWLIGGLLQEDECAVIGGEPKAGKTWFALQLALCLAAGRSMIGRWQPQRRGKALLYSPEGGPLLATNRLHQLCWGLQINPADIANRLIGVQGRLLIDEPESYRRLESTIRLHKPDMLVLDPLITVHTASENDAAELQPVLNLIRDLGQSNPGMAIVVVHHVSKGAKDKSTVYGLRGSSALAGWFDTLVSIRMANDGTTRRVEVDHRAAPPPPVGGFCMLTGPGQVDGLTALHLDQCDLPEPKSSGTGKEPVLRKLRNTYATLLREESSGLTRAGIARALKLDPSTITRNIKQLMAEGYIEERLGRRLFWVDSDDE